MEKFDRIPVEKLDLEDLLQKQRNIVKDEETQAQKLVRLSKEYDQREEQERKRIKNENLQLHKESLIKVDKSRSKVQGMIFGDKAREAKKASKRNSKKMKKEYLASITKKAKVSGTSGTRAS